MHCALHTSREDSLLIRRGSSCCDTMPDSWSRWLSEVVVELREVAEVPPPSFVSCPQKQRHRTPLMWLRWLERSWSSMGICKAKSVLPWKFLTLSRRDVARTLAAQQWRVAFPASSSSALLWARVAAEWFSSISERREERQMFDFPALMKFVRELTRDLIGTDR